MKAQHSYLGIPAIVIFTFIPALLWLNIMPLADRFNGTPATLTSLGQLCGLTGLALFAAALILSSRLKLLEPYFGGINRAFIIHHIIGGLAFSLLLVHPVALTIRYMYTSYGSAYRLLFDFADLPVTFGHLALYAMIGLLFVTFFVKLPYHIWKISHQFMGAAFLFAALHTLLISSDVARDGLLRTYMIFVLAVGLAAYDYKTVFGKYLIRKYNYKLVEIKARAQNVIDLVLSPENGNFKFAPGQFAFLAAQNGRLSAEQHPFSVSSAPNETTLTFSIKNLGDYTAALFGNLKPGDQFVVEGPYGRFSHQLSKFNRQVWIGGGIGITPFLSMAKSLDDKYEIDCYY